MTQDTAFSLINIKFFIKDKRPAHDWPTNEKGEKGNGLMSDNMMYDIPINTDINEDIRNEGSVRLQNIVVSRMVDGLVIIRVSSSSSLQIKAGDAPTS